MYRCGTGGPSVPPADWAPQRAANSVRFRLGELGVRFRSLGKVRHGGRASALGVEGQGEVTERETLPA